MCNPRLGASVESEAFIAALEALRHPKSGPCGAWVASAVRHG